MTFEETRERIVAIDVELDRLQREKTTLLKQLRERCAHQTIIEQESCCNGIPHRICLICGLEEYNRGSGFENLIGASTRMITSVDELSSHHRLGSLELKALLEKIYDIRRD